jgi:hypothetical protein
MKYLDKLPYNERDAAIEAEMCSAFKRFFTKPDEEFDRYGYTATEDKQNLIFLDWFGTVSGALTKWFKKRNKTIDLRKETNIVRLNFFDVIDLCNACSKASGETGAAYFYGVDESNAKRFFPAQHRSEDGERYGHDYCEELHAVWGHTIKILQKTDFKEEFIYVIVKMREFESYDY